MIDAVVLAAGRSRRMGAQKLLLPFGRGTVLETVLDRLADSAVRHILVVVAPAGRTVADIASRRGASVVTNPRPDEGMLSSVRCGLQHLPGDCRGVLVALGDQPTVRTETVNALIDAFRTGGKGIVVPTCGGRRGHPIVFSVRYRPEILTDFDDIGLRGLPRRHADDVLELPLATETVLADIDTPDDYRRQLRATSPDRPQ